MENRVYANCAFVTLFTKPFFFPGLVVLAHSLKRHAPDVPLIIAYTPNDFLEPQKQALAAEAKRTDAILCPIEPLRSLDEAQAKMAANITTEDFQKPAHWKDRFADIWTKLRVFMLADREETKPFDFLCYLDADMLVSSNPCPLVFSENNTRYLHDQMRLIAVPDCYCDPVGETRTHPDWKRAENCPLAKLKSLDGPGTKPEGSRDGSMWYFNGGCFAFAQSPAMARFVLDKFQAFGPKKIGSYNYVEQDFLNEIFYGNWESLPVSMNVYKVVRYQHPAAWQDDRRETKTVLHLYMDKPWQARVVIDNDGKKIAGLEGRDGETHSWWWSEYDMWIKERREQGEAQLIHVVSEFVAKET